MKALKPLRHPEANWADRPSGYYWIEDVDDGRRYVAEFISGAGKSNTGFWLFFGSEEETYVYAAKGFRVISRRLKEPSQ